MSTDLLIRAPLGLLPVVIFLFVLLYMDSYKLVSLKSVLWVIVAGAVLPLIAYIINGFLMEAFEVEYGTLIRYVAPVTEETLKALIIILLFRLNTCGRPETRTLPSGSCEDSVRQSCTAALPRYSRSCRRR